MSRLILLALSFGVAFGQTQTFPPPSGGGGGSVTGGTCTNQLASAISSLGVPTCVTVTSAYVDTSVAKTGTDVNTSNQVTATHLASALPVNQGGTGAATSAANTVFGNFTGSPAAPGFTAAPTFSAANLTNFPTLNQNTTGTAANVTGVVAGGNGGTGVNNGSNTVTLGGNLTTSGAFNLTLVVPSSSTWTLPAAGTLIGSADTGTVTAAMIAAAPALSAANMTSFPTLNQNTTGTAANVTGTVAVAQGGTGAATVAANTVFGNFTGSTAAPGFTAAPTFSAANLTNFPTLNQNTTGTAANVTGVVAGGNGGTGVNNGSKTVTLGGNLTTSGAFNLTFAVPSSSTWTLPAAGTLIGSADTGTVTAAMIAAAPALSAANMTSFPTFNQNTTGTAANVTGTVAVAQGGTGAATSAANTVFGNFTGSTAAPGFTAAPTFSAANLTNFPTFNQNTTGTAANVTGVVAGGNGGTGVNNGSKTVTLGGNLTTSGAFNLTFAVPSSSTWTLPAAGTLIGSADTGTVTATMIAAAPALSAANMTSFPTFNQNTTGTAANVTGTVAVAHGGTGAATVAANTVFGNFTGSTAAPGFTAAPTFSAANLTNFPTFNQNTTGTAANVTGTVAVANGGTGTASTLTGLVRGSASAMTAAEISGDGTTSGSNALTITQINGSNFTVNSSGVVTKSGGVTTTGNFGHAPFIAVSKNTGLSPDTSTSTASNVQTLVASATAGSYRLSGNIYVTAVSTNVCTQQVRLVFTLPNGTSTPLNILSGPLNMQTANSFQSFVAAPIITVQASTAITVGTIGVVATDCTTGTPTVTLNAFLERID